MFDSQELRTLLSAAPLQLKTMILLALNAGFGNADVGTLPLDALDLENGWVDYPRPKTGVDRRIPLWPETLAAITAVLADRPEPKDAGHNHLVFLTRCRGPWWTDNKADPISRAFRQLLRNQRLYHPGRGFYALRHVHRTIADGAKDPPAADAIVGHERPDMASVCRERIDDDHLRAVVDHVRAWLFAGQGDGT
jgi:integrase